MRTITFSIPGEPQGKARPRVVRNKYTGASMSFTPDKTVAYEELVRARYTQAAHGERFGEIPLRISIRAVYSIPKSKSNRDKSRMLAGELRPTKKPDCDNIVKIICDALNGVAYPDDKQIAEASIRKVYGDVPGVIVNLSEIKEGQ